ncbi:M14 family zinc carboxypeptidase [Streptomyces sp. NPDC047197]|uniref:M14 family zinc carboxypeptidase n=1 Tax=Streptomyces sp. NPDC047197 TaxID=3155477 RepID=UPI0033FA0533
MVESGANSHLSGLPDINRFRTVDELNAAVARLAHEHPDVCRLRRIGTSRLGDPLRMLSVGHGPRHALIVGGPHPNEPVGLLTVLHLARLVAATPALREDAGCTWNFIPCIDPDGTRLNEAWFGGPYTIRHYHTHFFRPAFADQPEWTFPVLDEEGWFDRTLPETQALARVIDELRPEFQYSLHNADFGGAFFILSHDVPGAAQDLAAVAAAQEMPLALSPVDTAGWPEAGPGVHLMPTARQLAAATAAHGGGEARHGGSSAHYGERHGTTTLITEVPLWHDPRAGDASGSGRAHAAVLTGSAGQLRDGARGLGDLYERVLPRLTVPSPMRPAIADILEQSAVLASAHEALSATYDGQEASVGEVFGVRSLVHMLRLRGAGQLRRQLAVEQAAGNRPPAIRAAAEEADALFDSWCASAEGALRAEPFPLRRLVAVQIGAALATVRRLGLGSPEDDSTDNRPSGDTP